MKKYESVIIINPNLGDKTKETVTKYESFINKEGGEVEKVEDMGLKNLAYEIKKNTKGYYVIYYFEANEKLVAKLERQYRIDDNVMKFITIRTED